ncbi:hypothetical protein MA16_Dca002482 [Dendrobium catenatum]|uniref:Uncharacterized protein n=1 Tax=Dendrobium catenatum TaxID=906689 RepID=A0A2I0W0M3_9ASPA|nr:hypothetical protein MA16_Dca002482 [Dendrobium catenatum]
MCYGDFEVNSGEVMPSGPVSRYVELAGCGVSSPVSSDAMHSHVYLHSPATVPLVNGLPQTSTPSKSDGDTIFINVSIYMMYNDDLKTHVAKSKNNYVCLQTDWSILDDFSSSHSEGEDVEFEEEFLASRIVEKFLPNVGGKNGKSKGKQ